MIVEYRWITERRVRVGIRGGSVACSTHWVGWFLLGIVPIFVRVERREYPR